MDRISDKRKSMAAMAVFRDLYNQKKDIYSVIAEFLKLAIVENGLKVFELQEIANIVKKDNGMDLPVAVIKRSLGRLKFLDRDKTRYTINPEVAFDAEQISKETKTEDEENQAIINQICDFYESKTGKILSQDEKETLCDEFCAFVIDDTNAPVYGAYISEYIISQSANKDFVEQLDQIRQGVLIFVAFSYNTNYDAIDKINTPLNIYLDTEILFHLCGLNGLVYKNLFDEFYSLVEEINKRAKKPIIRLHYFAESEDEINSYFYVAEKIVRKEERLDPSSQAMRNIVNGCIDPYDVVQKKADFFKILKDKSITLDSQERYYDKEVNYPFLINSETFYNNKEEGVTDKDIDRKVNLLNYVSIKRGFKSQAIFRNVGHILLSANKVTFSIAFDNSIRESNTVPLATSLTFLTNRFWMSLNKNLTNISSLKSINIITKAQIALSTKINDNVSRLYSQYVEEDKQGKYDVEKSKVCLAELHKSMVNPDELTSEKAEDYLDILSYNDIETYVAEKALLEAQLQDEKLRMKKDLDLLQKKRDEDNAKHQEENNRHNATIEKAANEIHASRNKEIKEAYRNAKACYDANKDIVTKKEYNALKNKNIKNAISYALVVIFLFVVSITIVKYNGENVWLYIIAGIFNLILFALPFVRPIIKHEFIANSYRFCFSQKYRKAKMDDIREQYKINNPEPTLELCNLKQIIEELQS